MGKSVSEEVIRMNQELREQRMKQLIEDELNTQENEADEYEVGEVPDQTEEIERRYNSCETAKELEIKFRDAVGRVIEGNKLPYLDITNMDNVYDMLQRGYEYINYLIANGAYKPKRRVHDGYSLAPTTILSEAIEQVEQRGDYKVMVALVDLDKSKPKEERLYTFTDIKSKKLREVICKEIEKEM